MSASPIRGVIAPNCTPFGHDLTVAEDLYVGHAKRLLAGGCAGLAPFGTTGEALSVGIDERLALLDALVAAGIDPARLIPGTGLTNLPDTARLTRAAVEHGCAGALVLPPFYYKNPSDDGLYRYFASLIELIATDALRIYLYHIPQVAGVGLPIAVVERLRREFPDQIVGIKDSSGDWENTRALLEIDGLIVYPGSELPLIEAMSMGAPGCITASANLNAAAIAEVIRLYMVGDGIAAEAAMPAIREFRLTLQGYAPIPAQKRLLALASGDNRWAMVRPPLDELPVEAGRELAATLEERFGFRVASG